MTLPQCLDIEAVIQFNQRYNGEYCLLDRGKLEAALARPLQVVFGKVLYPTPVERAAALMEGVASAHAFVDANKRTALWASMTYLGIQGLNVEAGQKELAQLVIDLVEHRQDCTSAALWINEHLM